MARNYARFITAIWDQPQWCALDPFDQWLYFLLSTQEDISAVGRLKMVEREWATKGNGVKESDIVASLERLDAGRFVVADFETFEVLVRAFVRIDGGFTNKLRKPVILKDAERVRSTRARATLSAEFVRVGLPELPPRDGVWHGASHALPDAVSNAASYALSDTAYSESPADDTAESSQVNSASDAASDSASGSRGRVPQPVNPSPKNSSGLDTRQVPQSARDDAPTGVATAETIIAEWAANGKRSKQLRADVLGQVRSFLGQEFGSDHIRDAIRRWSAKGNYGASALPGFLDEVVNGSRTNGSAPPSAAPAVDPDDPMTWGDDQLSRVLGFEPRPTLPSELMDDGVPRSDRDAWLRENIPAWRNGRRLAAKARLEAKAAR